MCGGNDTGLTEDLRKAHAACSLTLAIAGTFGNALSVALICRGQQLRTVPTMMLIVDLCVANMVSTTVVLPIIAVSSFYHHWLLGEVVCQMFAYIMYVALTAECLILINITICQYLVIVHRVSTRTILHHHKYLRLFSLLGLPWIITMSVYIIPLTHVWDTFGYDSKRGYCTLINRQENIGFLAAGAITLIAVMTAVTFYCYTAIFVVHFTSLRKTASSVQEAASRFKIRTRNAQLLKMITVILLNYTITYLPFFITSVADPCLKKNPVSLYTAIIYISWLHAATNPVIYALMNNKINAACCSLFTIFKIHCVPKTGAMVFADGIRERNIEINSST